MKRLLTVATGVTLTVGASLAWTSTSYAQTAPPAPDQTSGTTVVTQPVVMAPPPARETVTGYTGPNRTLLTTGVVAFGLGYIPAVIVAAESPWTADRRMYIPVAGPWINLADRPACGPGSISCDAETVNKVLISADGIVQGLGVLTMLASFVMPEQHVVTTGSADAPPPPPEKPSVHVTPAEMGNNGYGVAAFGKF